MATKRDLEKLEDEINNMDIRFSRIEEQLNLFVKLVIAFNPPTLLAVI